MMGIQGMPALAGTAVAGSAGVEDRLGGAHWARKVTDAPPWPHSHLAGI